EGAVLEALLLGERRRMDHGLTRSLQEAGIFHLFAISGAHIAIISFLLFSVFRLFRLKEGLRYIFLIVFLVHYALLVEGRPSVMRATVMALAYMVGKLLWRNVHLLNTLSFSAFFLLLFNPVSLFSLGFQLTFAATLSIILFFPRVMSHLPRLPLRISEIFALSLTAQAGVLPFILLAFNRVTFASLVLNFVAIPLVGLIMAFGAIFLLLSVTYAPLAGLLSQGLGAGVRALIATTEILDPFPWLSLRVPTPKLSLVLLYFLLLGSFLLPRALRKIKPLSGIGFLVVLALLVTSPFPSRSDNLKVTFLDVGQGDSVLVEFPGKKKMLVDGGGVPGDTFDVGEYVVSPFLWRKGIKKIDYLVLTHAHPDHLNGLKAVARNFRIGEFWEALSPSESPSYSELKRLLPATTIRRRLFRGGGFSTDGVTIQVLNPEEGPHSVPHVHNDQSLVLRIVYGKTSILLAGDIGWKAEKDLVEAGLPLRSWVLKSPHHGSDSSSSEIFMNAVAPKIVVISVGAGNRYGFPDSVVLDRYARWGAQVYRTDTDGAVEIRSDGSDVGVRTASSRHAPKGPLFPETRRAAVD
ncbi:MAG: DNA internalization-related competence protein ComEC/Rec2, partial [Candidatus Aminicenantales bacterium]